MKITHILSAPDGRVLVLFKLHGQACVDAQLASGCRERSHSTALHDDLAQGIFGSAIQYLFGGKFLEGLPVGCKIVRMP